MIYTLYEPSIFLVIALLEYIEENGNAFVPYDYKSKCGVPLGRWVYWKCKDYEEDNIPPMHVQALNDVGIFWELKHEWPVRFGELLEYKEKRGSTLVPYDFKENTSLGRWVGTQRTMYKAEKLSEERIQKLIDVGFVWEPLADQWQMRFGELLQYKEKHGNTLVPSEYGENPSLGKWVNNQRTAYKDGNLSEERIQKLNDIGFVWDPLEAQWQGLYYQLVQYKEEFGDTLVPHQYEKNPSLGLWVGRQRNEYKADNLSVERIQKLNVIGFVWDSPEAQWQEFYFQLVQYQKEFGNALVPQRYEKNPPLGLWVTTQRMVYKAGSLLEERIQKLNAIGFVWDSPGAQWQEYYFQLVQYQEEFGNALVPHRYEKNPSLGPWVGTQRKMYKAENLSGERIQKLNDVGFVWDPLEAQWMECYYQLVQYQKEFGNALVPQRYEKNPSLGIWVSTQRQEYKAGRLSDERIQKLNDIGFDWDPLESRWQEFYSQLVQYKEEFGNTLVPQQYEKNTSLGLWVGTQRREYKSRKLSQERILLLEKIGFVWAVR
jgi:hypothetical protein